MNDQRVPDGRVEMIDLGPRQCRFPVHTEGRHHTFCGELARGSWCEKHRKIVYLEEKR